MAETYYKYNDVKDIERLGLLLKDHKLWASTYNNLNDPMEWFFESKDSQFKQKLQDECKGDVCICCLSKTYNYGLMWSMYADEHRGVCIEVEIEDSENIKENVGLSSEYWVKYSIEYKNENSGIKAGYPSIDEILKVKSPQWRHEQEVRFVRKSKDSCYLKVKIKRVLIGVRASATTKAIIYGIQSMFNLKFDVVDMQSVGLNEGGVNFWKMYDGSNFSQKETDKSKMGFPTGNQ